MSELTRICVAGDWHGNTQWATSLIKAVSNDYLQDQPYPLFLQLGDFGIWPGLGGSKYREKVAKAINKAGAKLFFVDGNHENHPWLINRMDKHTISGYSEDDIRHGAVRCYYDSEFYWLPRSKTWTWHDRTWMALGGAESMDKAWRTPYEDWWPQEALTYEQIEMAKAKGHVDVMCTHDVPQSINPSYGHGINFPYEAFERSRQHSAKLEEVMDTCKPEYWMHGHLHMQYTKFAVKPWAKIRVDCLDMDGTAKNWCILNIKTMEWEPR